MIRYIVKRLLMAVPLLLLITLITFVLMSLAPYDAVDAISTPRMPQSQIDALKEKYGLDQPVWVQYIRWLGAIVQGDFGYSIVTHESVAADLSVRIPNTIRLILPAYLSAYALAVVLGLVAGTRKNRWADKIIDGLSSIGIATPTFWVGLMLILVFAYHLDLLPIMGMYTVGREGDPVDYYRHFILPYVTLLIGFLPHATRYVRSSTIGQMSEDYVTVQRSLGAPPSAIMFKHVLKNVLLPIVTQMGMALPILVTGAVITESVFNWPGVGPYFVNALRALDFPIIMAILILSSVLVIVGNLIADITYGLIDPRIKGMK